MENRAKILAIDDDPDVRVVLHESLGKDYELSTLDMADDLEEAVSLFEPDLVILDVMIPGPDGISACKTLRALPASREIPILFLTAVPEGKGFLKGIAAGGDAWLKKPFTPQELRGEVARLLGELDKTAQTCRQDALGGTA